MNDLGLIDEQAAAAMQFDLVSNWMEGNHPEYAGIFDDPDALSKEHDKVELFFSYMKSPVSENTLSAHHADLRQWLRKTDKQINAYTDQLFDDEFHANICPCGQPKTAKPCCCKKPNWLLWLALASILLIFINIKQYVVAAIYALIVLVLAQPKLLKNVL